jgi:hypothetical protein
MNRLIHVGSRPLRFFKPQRSWCLIILTSFLFACNTGKGYEVAKNKEKIEIVNLFAPGFSGAGKDFCLLAKNNQTGEWELFYDQIHGIDSLVPGIVYNIVVEEHDVSQGNKTLGSSGLIYRLDQQLSKDTLKEDIPIVLQIDSLNTFIEFDSLNHPYVLGKNRIEFLNQKSKKTFINNIKGGAKIDAIWNIKSITKGEFFAEKIIINGQNIMKER